MQNKLPLLCLALSNVLIFLDILAFILSCDWLGSISSKLFDLSVYNGVAFAAACVWGLLKTPHISHKQKTRLMVIGCCLITLSLINSGMIKPNLTAPAHSAGLLFTLSTLVMAMFLQAGLKGLSIVWEGVLVLTVLGGFWVFLVGSHPFLWTWDSIELAVMLTLLTLSTCFHLWARVSSLAVLWLSLAVISLFRTGLIQSQHHLSALVNTTDAALLLTKTSLSVESTISILCLLSITAILSSRPSYQSTPSYSGLCKAALLSTLAGLFGFSTACAISFTLVIIMLSLSFIAQHKIVFNSNLVQLHLYVALSLAFLLSQKFCASTDTILWAKAIQFTDQRAALLAVFIVFTLKAPYSKKYRRFSGRKAFFTTSPVISHLLSFCRASRPGMVSYSRSSSYSSPTT